MTDTHIFDEVPGHNLVETIAIVEKRHLVAVDAPQPRITSTRGFCGPSLIQSHFISSGTDVLGQPKVRTELLQYTCPVHGRKRYRDACTMVPAPGTHTTAQSVSGGWQSLSDAPPRGMPPALASLALLGIFGMALRDKESHCAHWADIGECTRNPGFMQSNCALSCSASADTDPAECKDLVAAGGCTGEVALKMCRASCFDALRRNLTTDTEGNCACARRARPGCALFAACLLHECPRMRVSHPLAGAGWYWGTDGECEANAGWMGASCARSCSKLHACADRPETPACAEPFECPLQRDHTGEESQCAERAAKGECRSNSVFKTSGLLLRCPYSCAVIDPPSASHTVTRPKVKRSHRIDAHHPRHRAAGCAPAGLREPLLAGTCPATWWQREPSVGGGGVPWRRLRRRCPRAVEPHLTLTPRIPPSELPRTASLPEAARGLLAADAPPIRLQVVHYSPRVRLLHHFVSAEEAAHLIKIATPYYHRSSTARAGADDKRTSHSATLSSHDKVVAAVRQRIGAELGLCEPTS